MTLYQNSAYKHGVGWSIWHFEWVTKYRYKVFRDEELKKLCGIAFEEAARRYRFRLEDYEIQPEHIHLLVHLRPSMSPSEAVGLIKGYSSRLLFLAANEKLLGYYKWNEGKSLWGDGKFMASVGHITLEKAKEYLEKQETHHANNSTESPPFRVGVEVNLFHKTVSSLFGHLKLKIRIYVYNPSIGNHKVKLANAKARFYLDKRANQTYYIWRLASTKIVEEWKGRVQTITGNHQYYASILRGFFAGEGNIKTGSHSNRTIRIAQGKPFPLLEKILTKFKVDFKYSLAERSYVIVGKRNWDVLAQLGIADLHPIKKTKFWNTYNSYKEEHYSANYLKTKILQLLEKPYTSQ